jgi:glycosyltransferase involved in cell wall biosynthesis
VIASENSGAPGFITSGQEGILYPYYDEDALCSALDYVLSRPEAAAEMGLMAHHLARRWTWQDYRRAFIQLIGALLNEDTQNASRIVMVPSKTAYSCRENK